MRIPRLAVAALLLALLVPGPGLAQDGDSKLDRLIQQVEALLTTLRADPRANPDTVAKLEDIAKGLHEMKDGAKGDKAPAPGAPPGGDGGAAAGAEWIMKTTIDSFLRGTDLKSEDRSLAEEIIREFVTDYRMAKDHEDEKSKPVIRDHTEKRITRSFASRDANKLKENLDEIIKFWERGWGKRGR